MSEIPEIPQIPEIPVILKNRDSRSPRGSLLSMARFVIGNTSHIFPFAQRPPSALELFSRGSHCRVWASSMPGAAYRKRGGWCNSAPGRQVHLFSILLHPWLWLGVVFVLREFMKSKSYEDFVEKFKPKKTTDDCYTPPLVYETVKEWACEKYGIQSDKIVRPFYPGEDYEHADYPDGCVVLDNPPFSILSKICEFYLDRNIPFFLFAPSLTAFSGRSIVMRMNHVISWKQAKRLV